MSPTSRKTAQESMTRSLITIGRNERMETAYRRMRGQHVRHLPVIDEAGSVIGMLSDRDVLRSMISRVERAALSDMPEESVEFDPEARVRDYMTWPAISIDRNADIRLIAERMLNEKVSSVLVQDSSRIAGIVTTDDLLRVLIGMLDDPKTPASWKLHKFFHELEDTLI